MIGGIGVDLNFFQSLIFGFLAGLSDILPVSAQAHKSILLKLFGEESEPGVLRLVIHVAILVALYYGCQIQIQRLVRQQKLAKVPKRRRKRPVDMRSIMDFRLLKTMLLPVIVGFLIHFKTAVFENSLAWIAAFLIINGVLLFLPALLPSGNKDSRAMTRVDGLMMGLGGAASALPGVSSIGAAVSVAMVRGTDRVYAVNMALLMHMGVTAGLIIFDFIALFTGGVGTFGFGILIAYLVAGLSAFAGTWLGIRLIRSLAVHIGLGIFAYYCWGAALLAFILYLSV